MNALKETFEYNCQNWSESECKPLPTSLYFGAYQPKEPDALKRSKRG